MLRELFSISKFLVTSELTPPFGNDLKDFRLAVKRMRVDAVKVLDHPRGRLALGALASCLAVKEEGREPILQLTCRDRNSLALQGELLAASALGVHNVLVTTGEPMELGDHPTAKPVFELDSIALLKVITGLNDGYAHNGQKMDGRTKLFAGARINLSRKPLDAEAEMARKKFHAGARFSTTLPTFQVKKYCELQAVYEKKFHEPLANVLIGVPLVNSAADITDLKKKGFPVPESIERQFRSAKFSEEAGLALAQDLMDEAKKAKAAGVHLVPGPNFRMLEKLTATG